MRSLNWLLRFAVAAALVGVIGLLVASRPAFPTTVAFHSARRIDEVLIFVAWLGLLLLAGGLLYRIAPRRRHRSLLSTASIRHLHPTPRAKPLMATVYSDRAFPLILKRPHVPAERPHNALLDHASASFAGVVDALPQRAEIGPAIALLGPVTISGGRKHIRRLRGPTRELLAYLALHPSGAHRDQIIDALWPDQPPEQGRKRLWRAAGDARSHFGETILNRDGEHYQLDRTQLTIDLDQLDQLVTELKQEEGADDQVPLLKRALALFRGEPLAGSDYPWAENEQRRLHAVQLDLLERAGRACLALSDPTGALANAEAGLALEPYNEHLARLAMEAEAALGLRSALIDRYQQLRQTLQEQLGLEPHSETKRLYRRLLAQDDPEPAAQR